MTNEDGSFGGVRLLDNWSDVLETLKHCHAMIWYLACGDVSLIKGAEKATLAHAPSPKAPDVDDWLAHAAGAADTKRQIAYLRLLFSKVSDTPGLTDREMFMVEQIVQLRIVVSRLLMASK